jgi:hypothetical protein
VHFDSCGRPQRCPHKCPHPWSERWSAVRGPTEAV